MSEKVFEFRDLFLEVNNNDKNIKSNYVRLLDGISGKFISGEITAVMGASGSGKSTLFDMLLGRVSSDSKSYGTILYNNQERNAYDWIRKVAYLRQDDIYFEKFTILESIMFDLDFYQPFKSNKEKLNFAEILLKRSSIYEKRNAYISSLSGGERKRAMIARSMCSDPEIIFMDEPTSGLDSHSALTLINFLKDFAKEHNKLVIISVHQPGEALFNLFDKILYLENGSVFYNGKIKDIPEWLVKNNLVKPEGMSLAEFLFELLSDNPHLPEIRRFHPMVNEIIASNKQKYDHIRRNCALESNISTSYFEMSFSIIDIITFIRRFYLDLFRTGNIFSIFLKDGFYIGFLTVNCILFSCLIDKLLLDKLNPEENDFNDLIEGAKVYYTSDMKKYTSFFLFHLFSHFGTLISFFIRNICNKRSQILEDIYSAKYSVLTCFVGYFIHDFTLTLFSFGFGACTIVWCGLGPLINYWYLIFFFSMVFCYAINFIFLKCVIGFSCYSNYFSIILFLFNFFIGKEMGLMSPEFKLTGVLKVFTYPKYLSFFFPQLLLNAIFNYMNTEIVKMNTSGSGLKENRDFIPFISSKEFEGIEPKDAFSIIGLSSCPFRAFILVFVLSLLINIFGSLYFFNRHIGAMLRLKMNKQ